MKNSTFDLNQLAKKSVAPRKKAAVVDSSKPTPWAKEVFKRIDELHKALEGKKLA